MIADANREGARLALAYDSARASFRTAAEAAGAALEIWPHPMTSPTGGALAVDAAWAGSEDAAKVLVVTSGLHGIEGDPGSAAQAASLKEGLAGLAGGDMAIWLLHGVNPWGFAHGRRCNETGVDCNRNFLDFSSGVAWSWPAYDAPAARLETSPGFMRIGAAMAPAALDGPERDAADAEIAAYVRETPFEAVKRDIACGQYDFPDAAFYAGSASSWTAERLEAAISARLRSRRAVAWIDIHTGLGPRGHGALLGDLVHRDVEGRAPEDPGSSFWADATHPLQISEEEETVAYPVQGSLMQRVRELLSPLEMVTTVLQEFGTQDPITVLNALRSDHSLHAHGDPTGPDAPRVKDAMRAAFAPDDAAWRTTMIEQAVTLQLRGAENLARY